MKQLSRLRQRRWMLTVSDLVQRTMRRVLRSRLPRLPLQMFSYGFVSGHLMQQYQLCQFLDINLLLLPWFLSFQASWVWRKINFLNQPKILFLFVAKTASCINPIVYAVSHPKFREAMARELPCFGIGEKPKHSDSGTVVQESTETCWRSCWHGSDMSHIILGNIKTH